MPDHYMKEYDSFLLASLITDAKWELMSEYDHPVQLSRNRVLFVLPGENPGCIIIADSFPRSLMSASHFLKILPPQML